MRYIYRNCFLKILPFVLVFLMGGYNYGQDNSSSSLKNKPFKERLFVGGSLGFSVGSNSSLVEVAPILGFAVTKKFVVGLGLTYKYYIYRDYYALTYTDSTGTYITDWSDYKTNIYGGSIWARYFLKGIEIPIIENIFFHVEVEPLVFNNNFVLDPNGDYYDGRYWYSKGNQRNTITGIFLGGGLQQPLGGRSYMYLEVLWNFNEDLYYTPYSNPRIRIGIAAGL